MDVDKPLDQLVKENRGLRRSKRRPGAKVARTSVASSRRGVAKRVALVRPAAAARRGVRGGRGRAAATVISTPRALQVIRVPEEAKGKKLFIANVAETVNTADLRELFQQFSCVKAEVHYSPQGKHLGTAIIECKTAGDAEAGRKEFSGRALDGKALQISVIADEGNASLAARLGSNAPVSLLASLSKKDGGVSVHDRISGRRGRGRGRGRGRA